ncbi:MAG: polyamine aminopropyltransferase [Thermoanaerobacterales bacterium]|nr:polyamine aminopropyltransferase [Bacillota bacterium]MDI6905871.1 polyamine aminopropyltransferase [Thermoanaerobacterales bacterium]
MPIWYSEQQNENLLLSCRIRQTLHVEKTPFQDLAVVDTVQFGRMLVLDGVVQTAIADEFAYHEMLAHVPLNAHPAPRRVLIIGGGDGGLMREVVKHKAVERATLCEIDERVVEVSKQYLPELAVGFEHPKAEVFIGDGIRYVSERKDTFDVILCDSTDPIGPSVGLFSREFYQAVYEALRPDGIFVAQTESPYFHTGMFARILNDLRGIFPVARGYWTLVPSYPSAAWSFSLGSKKYDPLAVEVEQIPDLGTRYYTPEIHKAAFALPRFVLNEIEEQAKKGA